MACDMLAVMLQRWHEISFLHWSCDPRLVQTRLPRGLEVDAFDGKAWIGLTPFLLAGLRPPLFPQVLGISFPETNLRTYVRGAKGPGIWFFSLDAARLSAVVGARATYGLPYHWADMEVRISAGEVIYFSNRGGRVKTRIRIAKADRIDQLSALEEFLTERYRLYSVLRSGLISAEVKHPPWSLNQARVLELEENLRRAAGLEFPGSDFLVHHSAGVDTRIGLPHGV